MKKRKTKISAFNELTKKLKLGDIRKTVNKWMFSLKLNNMKIEIKANKEKIISVICQISKEAETRLLIGP